MISTQTSHNSFRKRRKLVVALFFVSLRRIFAGSMAIIISLPIPSIPTPAQVADFAFPKDIQQEESSDFDNWWSQAQRDIEKSQYQPSLQDRDSKGNLLPHSKWHFFNAAQNLRSYVTEDGWSLEPGTSDDWNWNYQAQAITRGDVAVLIPQTGITSQDDHITIHREQSVDEWFANSKEGIKQNFTIHEKPQGEGSLTIRGDITTSLVVSNKGAESITFSHDGKPVLEYKDLVVTDADGKRLYASLDIQTREDSTYELSIIVDDKDAVYPIYVDPLSASPDDTVESNQADAQFGYSVSSAGDVNNDGYDDVIVGAPEYDNGQTGEGSAFVYHGSSSGLPASANWTAESDQASAQFGYSVSTAGDVNNDGYSDVIVGAYTYDNGESNEGAAFVYHGSSSGLSASANWTEESDQASASFGVSVSTAGDVNNDGYSDVIVGAYTYDNGQSDEGRAFVYHGSGSGLSVSANWTAESNQADAYFGVSVSTAGDVNNDGYSDVIVGARSYDNGQSNEGAAFVYHGSGSGLSASSNWTAESDQASAQYGISVATAGDVNNDGYADVIVGANLYDNGQSDEGRAFVYHGSGSGLSASSAWTAESNQADAQYGVSVSTAGDVSNDGYSDVIIGANLYDNGQTDEGRAFTYHGSSTGLSTSANWTEELDQASAQHGYSVSTAGDVNNDGYSDVIVGARLYDNGQSNEGSAFLYYGSADPDVTNPAVSSLSPVDGATDVAVSANLVITFDEAVDAETGNITIKKASDDSTVESIDVIGGQVTGTGTTTITINPSSNLANATAYYVQIAATAFDDTAGNSYAGIANTTSWNFTTVAAPTPTPTPSPANTAPAANTPFEISQATDGSGYVTFKTTISDADLERTKLKVEYSTNSSSWGGLAHIHFVSTTQGEVDIVNNGTYQIQSIDTDTGQVTLTIVWDSKQQFPDQHEQTMYLRVTPYDDTEDGDSKISDAFELDNKPPDISALGVLEKTTTTLGFAWEAMGSEESFPGYTLCYGENQGHVASGCISSASLWDVDNDSDFSEFATQETTITGLTQNTIYYLLLTATDAYGNATVLTFDAIKTVYDAPLESPLDPAPPVIAVAVPDTVSTLGCSLGETFIEGLCITLSSVGSDLLPDIPILYIPPAVPNVSESIVPESATGMGAALPSIPSIAEHPAAPVVSIFAALLAALTVFLSIPTALVTLASLGGQLPYLAERLWQSLLGFFGINRKKRPWGRVINVATGEPLPGVAIRIIDPKNNRSTAEISGPDGSFQTYLPSGVYSIVAFKLGWELEPHPPMLSTVAGEQIYIGTPITVTDEQVIALVIPMRELAPKAAAGMISWHLLWQKLEVLLSRLSWPFVIFGFSLNTFIMLGEATLLNVLIELLYAAIIVLKMFIQIYYRPYVGSITDAATGKPVALAAIRLYDASTGRMVATKVTTVQGKFFILAPPGTYTAQIVKDGYDTYRKSSIVVASKQSQALSMSIQLNPAPLKEMAIEGA